MLIQRGRDEGWLTQPVTTLPSWAAFNGVSFHGVEVNVVPGFENRGSAIVASATLADQDKRTLMTVPRSLVLSREVVDGFSKSDKCLREVLASLGDFGRTTRGAILVFLLLQATKACPDVPSDIGVVNPLTDYIKFLPAELLPTFWTEDEQFFLIGTSLKPAVTAKLNSLAREFESLRESTKNIEWCNRYWWQNGLVEFDDWKHVDAMYRSRALEFPGVGDCMVPCVDMANHASGEQTTAIYETDDQGNATLQLRDGKSKEKGEEVTITYGDDKGACEMIFSYGFLEDGLETARVVFLDLKIPDDDPLKIPKMAVCTSPPGFRIHDKRDGASWESDFIWLVVVNEEDGLEFDIAQTTGGQGELKAFWKGREVEDTTSLTNLIKSEPLYEVFRLRAVALIQDRVEQQLQLLYEAAETQQATLTTFRELPKMLSDKLKWLERELLEKAYGELEEEKISLFATSVVQDYLTAQQTDPASEEDFS